MLFRSIIAPQLGTLRELARWSGYPGLRAILEDPRVRHLSGDGRRYLAGTPERFDIIQADALRPHSAYAGNLYSDAYFSLLRSRLAPGGLAVSWAPTARIVRTFVSVFPHVAQHGDVVLGSTEPIVIDVESFLRRLRDPHVTDYYTAAGVNIAELLAPYTAGWRLYGPTDRRDVADVNTDLHPRDEFNIAPLLPMPFF